ncbi:Protein tyrosine kinase [Carpediemonas membranifera]|uniref:Protein tyrosine kinase n=1 Tax=Carpediemonas membranifera TaxID=201153 RepID=A0A8J6B7G1_9EUKA|nr:Protein tyrosine kinase [Carpediemonas membranifera]|eukprot:KAG9397218.1 Protein tyrosine kinase [Carpediemonas membranifera]
MVPLIGSIFAASNSIASLIAPATASDSLSSTIGISLFLLFWVAALVISVLIAVFAVFIAIAAFALFVGLIIFQFVRGGGPGKNENVMVPPNPTNAPLVRLSRDQARVTQRTRRHGDHIQFVPFEDNEWYQGRVSAVGKSARVFCNKVNKAEHADKILETVRAQHAANIIGICRVYGFMRDNQHQFIFKETPTRALQTVLQIKLFKFPWETRLQMTRDVATTMAQAHAQGLTHGNLCDTTILVFNDHAKIDDFGLNPEPGIQDYYAHDIEQFGRIFWRVMHRRSLPYDPADLMIPPPEGCPPELYTAVMACIGNPNERPNFEGVCKLLGCPTRHPDPLATAGGAPFMQPPAGTMPPAPAEAQTAFPPETQPYVQQAPMPMPPMPASNYDNSYPGHTEGGAGPNWDNMYGT